MTLVRLVILTAALLACGVNADHVEQGSSTPSTPSTHLYPVEIDGKYAFIDEDGNLKFTLPEDVYTVGWFSEGLAVVAKQVPNTHGRWGYIDHTGKVVIDNKFNLAKTFSEGLAAVLVGDGSSSAEGRIGYIDRTGRMVIQPKFDQGGVVSDYAFSDGLAAVALADQWGYIDKTGRFVIEPKFHVALPFSEGRAVVGIAEPAYAARKYGVIDKQGRWIVTAQYERVGAFSEGLASILIEDKLGFIDLQGQVVIKPQFAPHSGCPRDEAGGGNPNQFVAGLAAVQVDRKWGFIDRSGKWLIKPLFDCALPFNEGLALVGVRDDHGRWLFGYIDKAGVTVIKPQYSQARSFIGKLARVWVGMSEGDALVKALQDHEAGKPKAEIEKELEGVEDKYVFIDRTGKVVWKHAKVEN